MKTFFTRIFILSLFVFTAKNSSAQLNYLTGGFTTFPSTYNDIGTGGTVITMTNNDSGHSAVITLPFSFTYNYHSYTSAVMYVDGFIKLGDGSGDTVVNAPNLLYTSFTNTLGTLTGGPFNNATTTAVGSSAPQDSSLIVPFGEDLYAGANTPDFRYAVTGTTGTRILTFQWKNVSDKLQCGVATQYDTINFQVKLYEGTNAIEFVYGRWVSSANTSNAHFAACGLKGSNCTNPQLITLTKGSAVAWSSPTINAGNYTVNALNFGNNVTTSRPAPDPGRVYHFNPVVYNDAAVIEVRAIGKIALSAYSPDSIRATIANPGINALTGLVVTLTISGTNTFTTTTTVSSIASGGVAYIAFPPYTPTNTGACLITVSVPTDDNTTNNSFSYGLSVSDRTLGYTDTTRSFAGSNGSFPTIYACKYRIVGSKIVSSVKFFIPSNSAAVGAVCQGVVIDSTNTIRATSATYTLTAGDMGTYVSFNMIVPPVISNTSFFAGISVISGIGTYYLNIYQSEGTTFGTNINYNRPDVELTFPNGAGVAPTILTTGRYMIECNLDPLPAIDAGVSAAAPVNNATVPSGVSFPLRAYVKNYGTQLRPSGIQVRYSVNGGPVIGPVSTTVSLNQNDTTSVLFTGANSLNFATPGTYVVKVYTSLSGDPIAGNDTITLTYNAVTPITTLPYRLPFGILTAWTPINNTPTVLWKTSIPGSPVQTLPSGVVTTQGLLMMDNMLASTGANAKVQSPVFSFAGVTRPILHFNVACAPHTTTGKDDTLQVLVSTDGGYSYNALYTKSSQLSSPSLGTVAAQSATYAPGNALDWRHESVDLSAYAGNPYVLIAFQGKTGTGNNVYIANIIVSNPASISTQSVSSPTTYSSGITTVNFFSSIGATGGELSISRYSGYPSSTASPVYATNAAATTGNSNVFTPTNVWDNWWTITYSGIGTGNLAASAQYYLQLDITGVGGMAQPDNLYIMKRSENNGSWTALSTIRSTNTLFAGPLSGFSDFTIGSQPAYNTLPVTWLDLTAKKYAEDIMVKWSTASEINNDHFVVERSNNGYDFYQIAEVKAAQNSNSKTDYTYLDENIPANVKVIYYRIKQIDKEGTTSSSKVVSVELGNELNSITVFPNPFNNNIELTLPEKSKDIRMVITDLSGRKVYENTLNNSGSHTISFNGLDIIENGFYLITVYADGNSQTFKMTKAN